MSTFQVNSEAIATASSAVRASISAISGEVAAMNGRLAELQSVWQGGAANAFHGTMEQWRSAQRQLEGALESVNQALAGAGLSYAEVEQHNTALFMR